MPRTVRGRSACVHSYVHACPHERINANVWARRDATHVTAFLTQLAMMRQSLRRQRSRRIHDLCARACSRSCGPRATHAFGIRAWQRCGAQFNAAARCRGALNLAGGCMCRQRSLTECSGSAPTCRVQKRVAALWCCARRRIRYPTLRVSLRALRVCVIWFCTSASTRGVSISCIGCHVAAVLGLRMFGQSNSCVMTWHSGGKATCSAVAEGKVEPISGQEKLSNFGKVCPDSGHKNEASCQKN